MEPPHGGSPADWQAFKRSLDLEDSKKFFQRLDEDVAEDEAAAPSAVAAAGDEETSTLSSHPIISSDEDPSSKLKSTAENELGETAGEADVAGGDTLGMLLVAGSAGCFSVMSLLVTIVERNGIPSQEVVIINVVLRLLIVWPSLLRLRLSPLGPAGLRWLLLRACGGFGGISCAFYSFSVLPLADATVLVFTAPCWTQLLSALFLGEGLRLSDCLCSLVSLAGVACVARPAFLFGDAAADVDDGSRAVGIGVALAGAISSAVAYCCVRKIGKRMHPLVLLHAFSLLAAVLAPVTAVASGQQFVVPSAEIALQLAGMGITGYFGQYLLNKGMQIGRASRTTLMRNLDVVLVFLWQAIFLQEAVSTWSVAGAGLIMLASLSILLHAHLGGLFRRCRGFGTRDESDRCTRNTHVTQV